MTKPIDLSPDNHELALLSHFDTDKMGMGLVEKTQEFLYLTYEYSVSTTKLSFGF